MSEVSRSIYIDDFSSVIYFMREGVSVQLLKETFAQTGEIDVACPSPSALAVN